MLNEFTGPAGQSNEVVDSTIHHTEGCMVLLFISILKNGRGKKKKGKKRELFFFFLTINLTFMYSELQPP